MANIKSIGGNPIVLGLDGLTDEAKATLGSASVAAGALIGSDAAESTWAQRVTTGDGAATIEKMLGNTVVWNQLCTAALSGEQHGFTVTANEGTVTVSGTNSSGTTAYISISRAAYLSGLIKSGHKYLVTTHNETVGYYINLNGLWAVSPYARIETATGDSTTSTAFVVTVPDGTTLTNVSFTPQIFDLTRMFGAGNEPSTVAEFESMFPEAYYPYDAGSLLSVNIEGVESVGRNLLDPAQLAASGYYQVNGDSVTVLASDSRGWANIATCVTIDAGTYVLSRSNTSGNIEIRDESGTALNWGVDGASERTFVVTGRTSIKLKVGASASSYPFTTTLQLERGSAATAYRPYQHAEHTIPVDTYFPNGMRSAGTAVRDELSAGAAVTRVGSRAHQSGDESDTSVVTDGTTTYYALTTPTTVTIDPPLNLTYKVERGGTESVMVPTGEQTAPPVMDVAYGGTKESIIADALSAIAAQDGPTATANHSVGSYLTMGGTLYKVTSAIAAGETITAGTNVTATTVMAEVIALTQ